MEKNTQIEIEYSKNANVFFETHPDLKDKFIAKLKAFYKGDKNVDIKIIKGIKPTQHRMRIGKYRIIFYINKEKLLLYSIFVKEADSRGDIY